MKIIGLGFGWCALVLLGNAAAQEAPIETTSTQQQRIQEAFESAQQNQRAKPSKLKKTFDAVADTVIDPDPNPWKADQNPETRRPRQSKPVIDAQDAVSRPAPQ